MSVLKGVILWVIFVVGTTWIQLDGIHYMFDISAGWAVVLWFVSGVIFAPSSLVWLIAGLVSYF